MILAKAIVNGIDDELIDYILVENTAQEMRIKLEKKRQVGRGGWHHPNNIDNSMLFKMLCDHVYKGDMIDVINLAAMIHARHDLFGEATIYNNHLS